MAGLARFSDPGRSWAVHDLPRLALTIRLRAVQMVALQGFGYLGQALSRAEQVAALFAVARPGTDRLVCSPGHYVIAFYAAASEVGLIPAEALSTYGQDAPRWRQSGLSGPRSSTMSAGLSARDCRPLRASRSQTGSAAATPARTRLSATARWRRARSGRRRCSRRTTGCPG